ncbi:hypothetical protein HYV74_03325 [Candidatus Uhrbacteria bacterium]|nr:hypothetical protein [Candidatus Uhrbacteria bacterium]
MISWFHAIQEITNNLPTAARIIHAQTPRALAWAQRRNWECAELLAQQYKLIPRYTPNGIDWSGRSYDRPHDLLFFDHYYGTGVQTLRLSLQLTDAPRPTARFEMRLVIADEDDKETRAHGHLAVQGMYRKPWRLDIHLFCKDTARYGSLRETIGAEYLPETLNENHHIIGGANIAAHAARVLYGRMASCIRTNKRKRR